MARAVELWPFCACVHGSCAWHEQLSSGRGFSAACAVVHGISCVMLSVALLYCRVFLQLKKDFEQEMKRLQEVESQRGVKK